MTTLLTPGDRMRYFARTYFRSITDFAHSLGYGKPGSLYDYFSNAKLPGARMLDRFLRVGGNPLWLRYGTGSMFADNEAGRALRSHERAPLGPPPPAEVVARTPDSGLISYYILAPSPGGEEEELYLLMNSVYFKMRSRKRVAADVLQMYKQLHAGIGHEIARMEKARDVLARVTERSEDDAS